MKHRAMAHIAVAGLLAFSLSGCGVAQALTATDSTPRCDTRTEKGKTMNDDKTSRLDQAGLKEIYAACEVTFDLTTNELLKEDLGIAATAGGVPDVVTDGLMTLRLHGSQGTLTAHTDHVTFFAPPERVDVREIAYFLTAETPEEFFTIIRDGAEAYGFDQASVERHIKEMKDYPDEGDKVALQPGYKLGFQVIYDLTYRGPGHVNTIIVSINPTASEFQPLPGL